MKNHKKILISFMFLFIYFVMPSNVWADENFYYASPNRKVQASITVEAVKGDNGNLSLTGTLFFHLIKWEGGQSGISNPSSFDQQTQYNPKSLDVPAGQLSAPATYLLVEKYHYDGWWGSGLFSGDKGNFWMFNSYEAANRYRSNDLEKREGKRDVEILEYIAPTEEGTVDLDTPKDSYSNVEVETTTGTSVTQDVGETPEDAIHDPIEIYKSKKKQHNPKLSQKGQTCADAFGDTGTESSIAWILQKIFNYIRIFGILFTVVLGAFDYTKALISSDLDALKKSNKRLGFRILGIVALILLPVLVNFLLGLFISGTITDFTCGIK